MIQASIISKKGHWRFRSETALEDFLWQALPNLCGLKPFKRQHWMPGQYHDILAIDAGQLVIIELKNEEDRNVTSQLTRYYHALSQDLLTSEEIDQHKPIRLVAIAPSFHEDNYILKHYSTLDIEFHEFQIIGNDDHLEFVLTNVESENSHRTKICPKSSSDQEKNVRIDKLPVKLSRIMADLDDEKREGIIWVRSYLLQANDRIKEHVENGSICYCYTKSKQIAEFKYDSKRNIVALFLRLPLPKYNLFSESSRCLQKARMHVWIDWQHRQVTNLAHVAQGLSKPVSFQEFQEGTMFPRKKYMKTLGLPRYDGRNDTEDQRYTRAQSLQKSQENDIRPRISPLSAFALTTKSYNNALKYISQEDQMSDFSLKNMLDIALSSY